MFWRKRKLEDFGAEIEAHLQLEVERLQEQGLSYEEARAAAHRAFGNVTHAQERFYESGRSMWLEHFWLDLRYALRMLRKSPGFTIVVALVLALGVGANAAMFSVVRAVLLRPLPYTDQSRLVYISEFWPHEAPVHTVPSPDFANWTSHDRLLDGLAAYGGAATVNVRTTEGTEHVIAAPITANFFNLLGVQPARGRAFLRAEDRPNGRRVIMLTWRFWRDDFNSDPNIIGQTATLDGVPYTIVGITPKDFLFPDHEFEPQIFLPIRVASAATWSAPQYFRMLRPLARVRRGTTLAQVQSELSTLVRETSAQEPAQFARMRADMEVRVTPLRQRLTAASRPILVLFSGCAGFLLILCCINVAGLMVARGISRTAEFAARAALGGSMTRLVRQVLNESAAFAILGVPFAVLVAFGAVRWLRLFAPAGILHVQSLRLDSTVLLVTACASVTAAVTSSLWPALLASRVSPGDVLNRGPRFGGGQPQRRVQSGLVVMQIAIATTLVVSSGLLARSLANLIVVNPGFDPHHLLTAHVSLRGEEYSKPERQAAFFERLIDRLHSLPGVRSVAVGSGLPTLGWGSLRGTNVEDQPEAPAGLRPDVPADVVSPNYFQTLGIPLIAGREFNDRDGPGSPEVAIVNQAFVRRFFPDDNPLGKRVQSGAGSNPWRMIVGVVGDVRQLGPEHSDSPEVYIPYLQEPTGDILLVLRTAGDPVMWATQVRSGVRRLDSSQPLYDVDSMDRRISASIAPERFDAFLVAAFAAVAVLLGAIGIYGVASLSSVRRTHEIGIRMALGAQPWHVGGIILAQALKLALLGAALGVAGALASSRFLKAFLYGVSGKDPLAFVSSGAVIVLVTLLASYIPARRAMKVDPMVALRHE